MPTNPARAKFDVHKIFTGDSSNSAKMRDNNVLDTDWIKSRFMVPDSDLDPGVRGIRYDSIATLKYVDSSIGGNVFINPRPQFNALTDPRITNAVTNSNRPTLNPDKMNTGIGEGYSRLIDDNQQVVYLQFGMPKFNSLLNFFFRAVDYEDSVLANTGRPSKWYHLGKNIGLGIMFVAFPILTITVMLAQYALTALMGDKSLKFYYFRDTMPMYWGTVNTLVTQLVTEQGLLSPVFKPKTTPGVPSTDGATKIGVPAAYSQADIDHINELIPGIISPNTNFIDIFAIITRVQRAALKQKELVYTRLGKGGLAAPSDYGKLTTSSFPEQGVLETLSNTLTFGSYLKIPDLLEKGTGDATPKQPAQSDTTTPKQTTGPLTKDQVFSKGDVGYTVKTTAAERGVLGSLFASADAGIRKGGAYAVFAVDYTGQTSGSFSNSTTSISIGDKAKALNSKSRELSFNLARGNLSNVNDVMSSVVSGAKDVIRGVLDTVSFGLNNVVEALSGNAYIEVPKRWDNSSMSFPQNTYTMQLISPYNSFVAQLQNIYIPLCMLLAGVLPLATGKSSYTSPYLCTIFSRGIENISLGMITSVNITKGTSNLAFDKKRRPLAIDVTFTVTDFSTMITSPVNSSVYSDSFNTIMESDTPLGNYLSVLGGRDLMSSQYSTRQTTMRLSRRLMNISKVFNADRIGFTLGDALSDSVGAILAGREISPLNKK